MIIQLLTGGLVSFANFGIHAAMTGLIVVITRRIAGSTDDLHVFMRTSALMLVTVVALTATHVSEIALWAAFMTVADISARKPSAKPAITEGTQPSPTIAKAPKRKPASRSPRASRLNASAQPSSARM